MTAIRILTCQLIAAIEFKADTITLILPTLTVRNSDLQEFLWVHELAFINYTDTDATDKAQIYTEVTLLKPKMS